MLQIHCNYKECTPFSATKIPVVIAHRCRIVWTRHNDLTLMKVRLQFHVGYWEI